MHVVYIGIGSNIGDRQENISKAISLIKEKSKIIKISSIYETEPVGYKDQDRFLNLALMIRTESSPEELFGFLQSIERKMGRVKRIKNGPRIIDLDILFYDDEIINEENLKIPHPRLHERMFVLKPLMDISPDFAHPVLKKKIREMVLELKKTEQVKLFREHSAPV